MAGFPGRIYYEGNESGAADLVNVAIKHAEKLHAWKQTQGIPNLVRAFDLGGGRYCVVADLNHMRALHVVSPTTSTSAYEFFEQEYPELEALGVVDVVSGVTDEPWIEQEEIELPIPGTNDTETVTVSVLKSFTVTAPTADRYTAIERRRRLAIGRAPQFDDGNTFRNWSHHHSQKPTKYTGAMRKLAQVILGVGKILRPTWEERWVSENKKSLLAIFEDEEQYKSAFGLYDDPKFTSSLQTRLEFDYRFAKTHGITFDQDDKPWLVEIGLRGVHIMPIYMDPVSQFEAGLQRYKAVNPELEEFLDEFGGMPLMVTMPVGDTFDSMKKAGEIRELVSSDRMNEFYSKNAYCSEHGWAFNSRGSEAHNTCYNYNDSGLGVGYHYRLDLRVTGETIPEWTDDTNAVAAGLNLSKLYELKKAQRLSELQARSILRTLERDGAQAAKEEFDDIEVEPTINATGNLISVRSGLLYHPARFEFQPQIKYPEPLAGGLISHDFGRLEGYPRPSGVKCNTPMFVTFVDDELDVVYYYFDTSSTPGDPGYNTRQECQYVGAWTSVGATPGASVQGHFYSERKDFRELLSGMGSKTDYFGRKLYDYHLAETPAIFSICVNVTKFRVFRISFDTVSHTQEGISISVAMPINDRSCYYMAKKKYISGRTKTTGYTHEEAVGGRTDQYRIYNFVWHWVGCNQPEFITDEFPERCTARRKGYRLNYNSCFFGDEDMDPVEIQYSACQIPGCKADLATGSACTAVTSTWNPTSIIGQVKFPNQNIPPPYSESVPIQPAEHKLEIWLFSNSGHGDVRAKNETAPTDDELTDNYQWWTSSPDEFGNIAQLYEVHSALGSQVMNYWDDMNTGELKHIGGPESMHASATACYTGVTE